MMKKDISANLEQKCLILCSKVLLKVQHNVSLKVLSKAFLATFSILFSYLQMVPRMHDPASILIC